MKYGQQFENESVPEWSLHNIDYNTLKHYIKANTTRNQATAIAIPGHRDVALQKFEDDFYAELCRQHDRVALFVTSKADELARRLQHLSDCIHNTLRRSASRRISPKRQRRLAKYEREALRCGDEIQAVERFVAAQVVAFRKIIKKYKKWTGSQNLGPRFRDNVLSDPKSFTNRDFHQLKTHYEDILSELRAATPYDSSCPDTPIDHPSTPARRPSVQFTSESLARKPAREVTTQTEPAGYWNEYDYGSEAGDGEEYAIYIDPNEDSSLHIPGFSALVALLTMPIEKAKSLLGLGRGDEVQQLLPSYSGDQDRPLSYGSMTISGMDRISPARSLSDGYSADEENMDLASDEEFPRGYETRYAALPSINEQRVARYRDRVLFWGTIAADGASLMLLGVAALLLMTGRHRLRVEVDAGVIIGVMASLASACAALGMTLARSSDAVGWANSLAVYTTFAAICVLNGMLLVLVMGNSTVP